MSKDIIKNDIKLMLNKLVSLSKENSTDNSGIISSIYNELDKFNAIDLFVTREYLKDSIQEITASAKLVERKRLNKVVKKKHAILNNQMKVVPDSAGNFFVVTVENGQEKIVMQTDNKAKADEFVKSASTNVAMGAPMEVEDDEEKLENIPNDDLPDTGEDFSVDENAENEINEDDMDMDMDMPEDDMPEDDIEEDPELVEKNRFTNRKKCPV